jgi:hypothetical protein
MKDSGGHKEVEKLERIDTDQELMCDNVISKPCCNACMLEKLWL